MTFRTNYNLNM